MTYFARLGVGTVGAIGLVALVVPSLPGGAIAGAAFGLLVESAVLLWAALAEDVL